MLTLLIWNYVQEPGFISVLFTNQKVHQVLAFKISRQMEATLVVETINQALECHQKPQYFHSDMGSQYTSNEVETLLERHQISHSYSKQGYPL